MPAWYQGPDPFNLGGGGGSNDDNDGGGNLLTSGYDTLAGAADFAAGDMDEAVARTFDDEQGGGIIDGTQSFLGITGYQESEAFEQAQQDYQEADGHLERFDQSVQTGLDFVLDNPNASLQDTIRGGAELVTGQEGPEDFAQSAQSLAQDFSQTTSGALEGTPLDNPVTDAAVWLGDALVADPAKAGLTALTGVDIDQGTAEGEIGAVEAFDVGVTVGTAGVGGAATSAIRGGAESTTLLGRFSDELGRVFGASDEAAGGVGDDILSAPSTEGGLIGGVLRGPDAGLVDEAVAASDEGAGALDEAAGASDETVAEAVQGAEGITGRISSLTDDAGSLFDDFSSRFTAADEAAAGADEAAAGADEAAGATDDAVREAVEESEEASSFISRFTDEAAAGADEAAGATDEGAGVVDDIMAGADDAAAGADEGGGILSGLTRGRVAAGGLGILGAGAVAEQLGAFDRLTVNDPQTGAQYQLIKEKDYQPTSERPSGGTLWQVRQDGQDQGYTAILRVEGRNVITLGPNGEERKAQVSKETFERAIQAARQGGAA